jgi:glycine/D-amino acid oxidase-like deaminating enzyme
MKIGVDRHGPEIDPDRDDRWINPENLTEIREYLAERFPSLKDAPLVESRVCQYENSPNGDFLIDRHPEHENVWLVGGGSGHGFKHGPAVGEYVSALITGATDLEPRFALTGRSRVRQRSIF